MDKCLSVSTNKDDFRTTQPKPVFILKGVVQRKMKIHSLSTHHYGDGGGGGVKCLSPQNTWDVIKQQKENTTCLHTAPVVSSKCLEAPT